MVGAAADRGAATRGRRRARPHRHAGRDRGRSRTAIADGTRGVRSAARAHLPGGRGRRARCRVTTHAPPAAGRRAAAPFHGGPPFGAALFQGPSDHRPQPRIAGRGAAAAAQPAAVDRHRPRRRRSDRRRHADGQGRHAWGRWSAGCRPAGVERITIDRGVTMEELVAVPRGLHLGRAGPRRRQPLVVPDDGAHPGRPGHHRTARRRQRQRHGDDQAALQRRRVGRRQRLRQRADRRQAGCRRWRAR